jgi:chromosome segregation ATPase
MTSLVASAKEAQHRASHAIAVLTTENQALQRDTCTLRSAFSEAQSKYEGVIEGLQAQLRHVRSELSTEIQQASGREQELKRLEMKVGELETQNLELQDQLLGSRGSVASLIGKVTKERTFPFAVLPHFDWLRVARPIEWDGLCDVRQWNAKVSVGIGVTRSTCKV